MSDFQLLTDEQHVLKRKGLYVGEDSQVKVKGYFIKDEKCEYSELEINPALCKIVNEIIDNSVDEYIRTNGKYANKINVNMKLTLDSFEVSVSDNGSGIPVRIIEGTDEYQPVLCWSRAKAGSNFGDENVGAGTYGVGSFLTYVFSDTFVGETHDGTSKLVFKKPYQVDVTASKKHGTTVTFSPDLAHFNVNMSQEIYYSHREFIKQRLINLSLCYPKIQFTFNDENVSIKMIETFAKAINENYIIEQKDKFSVIVSTTAEYQEFRQHCYANGLYNINGGSIIDYISSQLSAALIPLIKKKYKIEVSTGQIKNNLFIGFFGTNFVNLKFDSQTKERVTNSVKEVAEYFNYDFSVLAKKVMQSEAIIDPIVQAILFKKAQAENLELARQQKKAKNEKVLNHIPATFKITEECSCFIVEGLSARGFMLNVRESNKLGMFSLQGKIDNVSKLSSAKELMDVKVLRELMISLGLKVNQSPKEMNYGKIILATDADVDGSAISMLLINFFSLWGYEIFDKIYRVLPPLYSSNKKGATKYYYSQEEFDANKNNLKGHEIVYYKGLGSLDENAFGDMINNPRLIKIQWDDESQKYLNMLFDKKNENKRKDWLLTGNFE